LSWPLSRIRSRGKSWLALLPAAVAAASGQGGPPAALAGGQGETAFQGSYLGGSAQPLLNVTGATFHFQELVPGLGFLSGGFEGYASQNRFEAGQNFLELRGAPWMGQYWTVTGGDFRTPAALVALPFNNIFVPEIEGRGVKVQAAHGDNQYTFFVGDQTLTAGLRVAYRIVTPQTVLGASAVRRVSTHLEIGARAMQFSTSPQSLLDNPYLFPAGRNLPLVRTMAVQGLYTPVKRLKIYAEGSRPLAGAQPAVTSTLAGVAWEDAAFSFKTDYTRQGILYFPLAGYFVGDRQGPFAEGRWRPWKRLEFYGSASQYRNNLEHDVTLPFLTSLGTSAGAAGLLPGNLSGSVTLSTVRFSQQGGGQDAMASNNRQIDAIVSRPLRRHTLHVEWRDIGLDTAGSPQFQRSWEAGDNLQTKHFTLGGALRYQQIQGSGQRDSIFFRGLAQANLGRFSAYGNVEVGNDLQNQTLFSTSAYRTSVIGVAWRVTRGWHLQSELFRNSLNLALNPESIFLLQNGPALAGISPLGATLTATRQWSLYFRLSKQIRWGAGLPAESPDRMVARAATLVGTVAGVVLVKALDAARSAAGISVSLDGGRTAVSGADGRYVFEDVPEGPHEVSLALAELPADFDPGEAQQARVVVEARHTARADFQVLPLMAIAGQVAGPEGAPLEDIVIRMAPGGRYTTTGPDGSFKFYNIREGACTLAMDVRSLPEGGAPSSPPSVSVVMRDGSEPPPIEFRFTIHSTQKPIRKVEIGH
jgi:hypothetical protein